MVMILKKKGQQHFRVFEYPSGGILIQGALRMICTFSSSANDG